VDGSSSWRLSALAILCPKYLFLTAGPIRQPQNPWALRRCCVLTLSIFAKFACGHPAVGLKVIKALGHRLRRMGTLVEDLSFSTVRGRLVAHLIRLAEESGRQTSGGIEFPLNENNEELAARLGTVRELISRNLGRLHGEGLIEVRRRKVIVPHLDALRAEIAN